MKIMAVLCCMCVFTALANDKTDYGYLTKEDQQFFKNDIRDGNNQRERLDSNVKEINKLHGEINSMKAELLQMKQEIEQLKSKK
jgi:peptidoglycan hydrolase CwlO-like protein